MFRSTGTMEVNQIDLIGLEALRVFEPDLYEALPRFRRVLLEGPGRSLHSDKDKERTTLDALLSLARAPESRSAAMQILSVVFQPVEWLVQSYGFGSGFDEGWERELRACSSKHFDRYFLLALPEGDVSQQEVQALVRSATNRDQVVGLLLGLRERGLLEAMLDRLEAYKEKIPLEAAVPFTTAIFDVGDGLPGSSGMLDIGAVMHAVRIVFWHLRRFATMEDREEKLLAAIGATIGIQIPVHVVSMEGRREGSQKTDYLISEARLPEFNAACVEKIRTAAAEGRLQAHPDLASLLYRWRDWTDDDEPRTWTEGVARSADGAVGIIRAFTQDIRSQGISDRVATVRPHTILKRHRRFRRS